MKLKYSSLSLIFIFISFFLLTCNKDEIIIDPLTRLNSEIKEWMYNEMRDVYYWNYTLPSYNSLKSVTDPADFFYKLIYTPEDRWSWLTKDYTALDAEFDGTPTSMGISPVFGKFEGSSRVFIVIAYIYPGSPADRAGLKRGNIILKINEQELDTSNYSSLYNQNNFSVSLGEYDGTSIDPTLISIPLTAEIIDSNPVVFDTVFDYKSRKIGYLVYVEFIPGENYSLLTDFGLLMDNFKNQGVTDLVLDLRYNPGGDIKAANYLASCIAPLSSVASQEIFVKFNYNKGIQQYFIDRETANSSNLVNRFVENGHNLNLNRVFFLTGQRTASASELLIIGLQPYMDVTQIGDTTYGKYTGAWVLADTTKHNWAIVPIVSKYSNSMNFTNFDDGLIPDYLIEDQLLQAKAFGDFADPMLAQAVELITGQPVGLKKNIQPEMNYQQLFSPSQRIKFNLFLPKPEYIYKESE